tara:strand:- start:25 stop:294 length:270 start_codon:yes stop_codon:yes gene_type:complete
MNVNLKGVLILENKKDINIGPYKGTLQTKGIRTLNNDHIKSLLMIKPENKTLSKRLATLSSNINKKTRRRKNTRRRKKGKTSKKNKRKS